MNAIKATVKNGQIVVAVPADWPQGCEVVIAPAATEPLRQLGDDEGPMTPEEIAELLARMDQIEPLLLTPEEEAEWKAALKAQKRK